ncbi:hypothetical protein [Arthrobacter pigmenti]
MGLRSWLKGIAAEIDSESEQRDGHTEAGGFSLKITKSMDIDRCVELAGTTTFAKDAVMALLDRHGLTGRRTYESVAQLQKDPHNAIDPASVAVLVEGETVGNLPFYVAKILPLRAGSSTPVHYQLHIAREEKFRAKAYVWLDKGRPKWDYAGDNPPPLTLKEKRDAHQQESSSMVREARAEGGPRAREIETGMVKGFHYLELVEPIKQLKREGRLQEALELCYQAIAGAEKDTEGQMPAPWYTKQAAIVLRKLGERDEEIAVLERWLRHTKAGLREGSDIAERLAKLQAK